MKCKEMQREHMCIFIHGWVWWSYISKHLSKKKHKEIKKYVLRVWDGRGSNISFKVSQSQPPSFTNLNDKTCNSVWRGKKNSFERDWRWALPLMSLWFLFFFLFIYFSFSPYHEKKSFKEIVTQSNCKSVFTISTRDMLPCSI